jgi:hypothetical protein
MSVGFGAEGAITWASGSLATPVPAGEYPLVGVEAGLTRLGDQTGYWGGYWGGPAMMTRSVGSAAAGAPTPAVAEATGETVLATGGADTVPAQVADTVPVDAVADTMPAQIADTVAIEPMCEAAVDATTDCVTEIVPAEPLVVHLTGATLGLTMVWAQDGTVWLLPAYVFAGTDGGQYTVIAVDDAFLDLPEPYPTDSLPIDSYPTPDTATADTITIDTTTIDRTTIDTTTIDTTSATSATSG